eukprot:9497089-Pyramimonas_sp.AAC.1
MHQVSPQLQVSSISGASDNLYQEQPSSTSGSTEVNVSIRCWPDFDMAALDADSAETSIPNFQILAFLLLRAMGVGTSRASQPLQPSTTRCPETNDSATNCRSECAAAVRGHIAERSAGNIGGVFSGRAAAGALRADAVPRLANEGDQGPEVWTLVARQQLAPTTTTATKGQLQRQPVAHRQLRLPPEARQANAWTRPS